jgi:hypothetical protein
MRNTVDKLTQSKEAESQPVDEVAVKKAINVCLVGPFDMENRQFASILSTFVTK